MKRLLMAVVLVLVAIVVVIHLSCMGYLEKT